MYQLEYSLDGQNWRKENIYPLAEAWDKLYGIEGFVLGLMKREARLRIRNLETGHTVEKALV